MLFNVSGFLCGQRVQYHSFNDSMDDGLSFTTVEFMGDVYPILRKTNTPAMGIRISGRLPVNIFNLLNPSTELLGASYAKILGRKQTSTSLGI